MQIYVDEIPKNCDDCKFQVFVAHNQHGWRHHERYCSIMKDNYDCKCSKEHCPLKSLVEHDKQVRKEVCEEVRTKAEDGYGEECYEGYIPTAWVISEGRLKQIEGETN